jgi:hypothetical protein
MKTFLIVGCVALLCCSAPIAGDACCDTKSTSVEQRLRDIDLSIVLKQYEEIKVEEAKAQVTIILTETDAEGSDEERTKQLSLLKIRRDRLSEYAAELRRHALELAKPVSVAAK